MYFRYSRIGVTSRNFQDAIDPMGNHDCYKQYSELARDAWNEAAPIHWRSTSKLIDDPPLVPIGAARPMLTVLMAVPVTLFVGGMTLTTWYLTRPM
jgi:hypothetical protein